jgi:hypothetical protein
MLPDNATREPGDNLFCDINRIGKEEWRQEQFAENGIGGEHMPKCNAHYRHQHLQQEEIDAGHCEAKSSSLHALGRTSVRVAE